MPKPLNGGIHVTQKAFSLIEELDSRPWSWSLDHVLGLKTMVLEETNTMVSWALNHGYGL